MAGVLTTRERRKQRRRFYLETMRTRWSAMSIRQCQRFKRRYPVLAISIDYLVDEDLLPSHRDDPQQGDPQR